MSKTVVVRGAGDCLPCIIEDVPDDMTPEQLDAHLGAAITIFTEKMTAAWKAKIASGD